MPQMTGEIRSSTFHLLKCAKARSMLAYGGVWDGFVSQGADEETDLIVIVNNGYSCKRHSPL